MQKVGLVHSTCESKEGANTRVAFKYQHHHTCGEYFMMEIEYLKMVVF